MLQRPSFPKQKNVLVISDTPHKVEIENEEPYSSASNLNLLSSLRTGRVFTWSHTKPDYKGVNPLDIRGTYLDYDYFGQTSIERNFDFCQEIRKKKDLSINEEGDLIYEVDLQRYYPIPHQKDCYVSQRLWDCINNTLAEIEKINPKIIVLTGKWSLFFLTGMVTLAQTAGNAKDRKPLGGLAKFRSSIMSLHETWECPVDCIVVPIYHTSNAMGMPDKVPIMEIDLQKLGYRYNKILEEGTKYFKESKKEYILGTTKEIVLNELAKIKEILNQKPTLLSVDIECFFLSVIDCIGLTTSTNSGLCIPFATIDNPNYWSLEDEIEIMQALYVVMKHPNALHIGQNYSFDAQFYHFIWGWKIYGAHDTMVLHHILYQYLPKDLAFLSSLYCNFYQYWKDDLLPSREHPEDRWVYNIKDIQNTLEVLEILLKILDSQGEKLKELYYFQQQKLSPVLVGIMNRGVRIDVEEKERLYKFFHELLLDIDVKIKDILGMDFNQNSIPQKKALFKDFLGIELVKRKRKGAEASESCDAAAMLEYIQQYPIYKPLLTLMLESASLKVFVKNFLGMQLDDDKRARTQYRIAGTATGRLASTKNVRGKGGNLMNIPEKGKIPLKYAVELLEDEDDSSYEDLVLEGTIQLPNIKKIFLPDEGKEIMDADLSGADIQIVAWDSECKWLMDYFENPRGNGKVYHYIASNFFQREITDKEYKTYKAVFHGTNYKMGIAKLAMMAGIPEWQAKQLQDYYFYLNPEIPKWHERIEIAVKTKGFVENIFGRRAWFLNKNDPNLMNKAAAFIPQSSIADVMNRALVEIETTLPEVDILLQVHDSGVFQYDTEIAEEVRPKIKKAMEVVIPYNPPLIIPSDFKVSRKSYGDTEKMKKVA